MINLFSITLFTDVFLWLTVSDTLVFFNMNNR